MWKLVRETENTNKAIGPVKTSKVECISMSCNRAWDSYPMSSEKEKGSVLPQGQNGVGEKEDI